MERQAQSEREQQQHRRAPGGEIERIVDGLVAADAERRAAAERERGHEQRRFQQPAAGTPTHAAPQRRASARTLRNRPSSAAPIKYPASDRNSEPVANGRKCTRSDRSTTKASNGSGSSQPK